MNCAYIAGIASTLTYPDHKQKQSEHQFKNDGDLVKQLTADFSQRIQEMKLTISEGPMLLNLLGKMKAQGKFFGIKPSGRQRLKHLEWEVRNGGVLTA